MDGNNNSERDIFNINDKQTFRSFPRRSRSSTHGHGLLDTEYTDQFISKSSNVTAPSGMSNVFMTSSYDSQYPMFDLGFKKDARFDWSPGCGLPR